MARPCVGCGFTVDGSGNLQVNGLTSVAYPYTAATGTPSDIYCDTTSNELWVKPWAVGWGYIATGTIPAGPQLGTTTSSAATGVTLTWTAVANRRYRIHFNGHVVSSVAGDVIAISLMNGATAINRVDCHIRTATFGQTLAFDFLETAATSGSITRTITIGRVTGTGSVYLFNGAASFERNIIFYVEDIGPA